MTEENVMSGEPLHREGEEIDDGGSFERNLVFVAAPLRGDDARSVASIILDECDRLGLHAVMVAANPAAGPLVRQITGLIRRAEFLICDLTGEEPHVCYTLGYAHGVGNEMSDVLLLAADSAPLAFDIAPLPVRRYGSAEHLRSLVAGSLAEMMAQTRR